MSPVVARRLAALAVAGAVAAVAAPVALAADHTQQLDIGAQLVRQPTGKPWIVNLLLGSDLGMSDGTLPAPVSHMTFSFTKGAKVHTEAFGTCTQAKLEAGGTSACPASSVIGRGTAVAEALETKFNATVTAFNGPGTPAKRTVLVYARAIETVQVILTGTLRKTSGRYGWVLDLAVPRIPTVGGTENDAAITSFNVKVAGTGRHHTPLIEAPTSCSEPGWPFQGVYTYSDGSTGTSSAVIPCTLNAKNT